MNNHSETRITLVKREEDGKITYTIESDHGPLVVMEFMFDLNDQLPALMETAALDVLKTLI